MKKNLPVGRGFTLVELLVVILIIAVFAALSMAGYVKFRNQGDRATAISTMRQLQTANASYASDHNGKYVPLTSKDENNSTVVDWHENSVFLNYLTSDDSLIAKNPVKTTAAPVSILDPVVVRTKARLWNKLFASYGYNETGMPGSGPSSEKSFRVSQVGDPARTAAFISATDWIAKYSGRMLWRNTPKEGKSTDGKIAYRHGGKAIVTYYDGSTAMLGQEQIRSFDSKGGVNHPFWKADFQ